MGIPKLSMGLDMEDFYLGLTLISKKSVKQFKNTLKVTVVRNKKRNCNGNTKDTIVSNSQLSVGNKGIAR